MQHHTEIHLLPGSRGTLPRRAGVNLELQGFARQTNLWDWLADSGFQAVRQFHPELNLRRHPAEPGTWGEIFSEADYEARRARCRARPEQAFRKEDYTFSDDIPWLGVPDEILAHTTATGLSPVVSVGAYPRMFPRCLLPELRLRQDQVAEEPLDWEAAACLHEYAFALIWHSAANYGVQDFTTINEPENQLMCWFYPEELSWVAEPGADHWLKLFRDDAQPTGSGQKILALIADQYAATARVVRDALNDVQTALNQKDAAIRLRLHGPTNVVWKAMWERSAPFLDSLDLHHYNPDPETLNRVFTLASHQAHATGKPISCTEFNRRSGGTDLVDFAFNRRSALETVELYLQALQLGTVGPANADLVCLYLFSFPSTHRNYKHLVYGDMNLLDWSGRDQKPWDPPAACHPTFAEQQLRFATPAYHMIRLINRALCLRPESGAETFWMPHGLNNPTSAGPDDLYFFLKIHALRGGDVVNLFILNDSDQKAESVFLNLASLDFSPEGFVARVSDQHDADRLHAYGSIQTGTLPLGCVPPRSLMSVRLGPDPLRGLQDIDLVEQTFTPGSVLPGGRLDLWQTTRLAVAGIDATGAKHLLPPEFLHWESSCPRALRVDSGGLVQRVRGGAGPVTLTVTTADGRLKNVLTVPDCDPAPAHSGTHRHLGTAGLAEAPGPRAC